MDIHSPFAKLSDEIARLGLREGTPAAILTYRLGKYTLENLFGEGVCGDAKTSGHTVAVFFTEIVHHSPLTNVVRRGINFEVKTFNMSLAFVFREMHERFKAGAEMVWLMDVTERMVAVFRRGQPLVVFEENEDLTCQDMLPGFRCRVADFFSVPGTERAQ
jgi:hypothetical protein